MGDNLTADLGDGDDTLKADNLLMLGARSLAIDGGNGNDDIQLGVSKSKNFAVHGGNGDDHMVVKKSYGWREKNSVIGGGDGDDRIFAGSFNGTLTGGAGKNVINIGKTFLSVVDASSVSNEINIDDFGGSLLLLGQGNTVNIDSMACSMIHTPGDADAAEGAKSADAEQPDAKEDQPPSCSAASERMPEDPVRHFTNLLAQSTEIVRTHSPAFASA